MSKQRIKNDERPPEPAEVFDGDGAVEFPEWTVSLQGFPQLTLTARAADEDEAVSLFCQKHGIILAKSDVLPVAVPAGQARAETMPASQQELAEV